MFCIICLNVLQALDLRLSLSLRSECCMTHSVSVRLHPAHSESWIVW